MEDPLPQHRSPSPPAPSTNKRHSFSSPSPQSFPTSKAFLIKARRRLSEHRPSVSLPSLLNLRNLGLEGQKKLPKFLQTSEPAAPIRASSVAPTHHREVRSPFSHNSRAFADPLRRTQLSTPSSIPYPLSQLSEPLPSLPSPRTSASPLLPSSAPPQLPTPRILRRRPRLRMGRRRARTILSRR